MAGGIQVLRIETHARLDGGLVKHVLGTNRPETAHSVFPPVLLLQNREEEARILLAQLRKARKGQRGRRAKEAVSIVIAGLYPYGHPKALDYARELQWAMDSLAWLIRLIGPNSLVAAAGLHRDETSPHVHALIVPVTTTGRLTWCGVRDEAVPRMGRKHRKGKSRYSHFQDDYQDQVGIHYGLGRGNCGSLAKHEEIDRTKALERRNARIAAEQKDLQSNVVRLREQAESERKAVEAEQERQAALVEEEKKRKRAVADEEARMDQLVADAALAVQPSMLSRVPVLGALVSGPSTAAERGEEIRAEWEEERRKLKEKHDSLTETVATLRDVERDLKARVATEKTARDEHKATADRRLQLLSQVGEQKEKLQGKVTELESTVTGLHEEVHAAKAVGWQEFAQRLVGVVLRLLPASAQEFFKHGPVDQLFNGVMGDPPRLLEEAELRKRMLREEHPERGAPLPLAPDQRS